MEHTKGKWEIMPYTRRDGDNIRWVKAGKKHIAICQTFKPNAEANARRICQCVNSHDALLEACEEIDHFFNESVGQILTSKVALDAYKNSKTDEKVKAAIAATKE